MTVRVTRAGNEHVYMTLPVVRGDSLAGVPRNRWGDPDTVVVALRDIETLSEQRFSPAKTIAALALVGAAVLGIVIANSSFVSYGTAPR